MKKSRIKVKVAALQLNEGQLGWLPKNPRQWTQGDIDKTVESLRQDPDFLEDRPLDIVPAPQKGEFVVFGGNLRTTALGIIGTTETDAYLYEPERATLEEDRETIRRRAIKDNGQYGSWDVDIINSSEWAEYSHDEMTGFGVPSFVMGDATAWDAKAKATREMNHGGLSSEGREGAEGYNEFIDKFKQKLTTDDCYTPPAVWDAVRDFVHAHIVPLKTMQVVRPFYPGGDYTDLGQYKGSSIVIDNPPFSLLAQIIRFYCENSIPFFIFAPALLLFSARDCDVTYIISDSDIEYENGAKVRTGFITNLVANLRIWLCPELHDALEEAQQGEDKTNTGFVYPDNIVTAAILGKIVKRGVELKIRKQSCEPISNSDSAKEQGRALYGGGFILSDRAAAERAAAERAAAERAAATRLNLSEREKAIIARLNDQDKDLFQLS